MSMQGTRILVTGATGGLGTALAAALEAAGAAVAAHTGRGGDLPADLSQPGAAKALVAEAAARIGPLTGLVNAAAAQDMTPGDDADDWRRLLDINVTATVSAARAAMETASGGGAVVNIASVEAARPLGGHSAYAASKAALVSATRSLAATGAARGWRVNAVLPGLIGRDGLAEGWPDGVARWQDATLMRRPVTADEVAQATLFLLSPAASGITGAALPVDAGYLAAPGW